MAKLIECIPNFSVSKEVDPVVFQGLVDVANSVPGCTLLNVQTDGNHNRCVFTMVGSPAGIEEAAFRLTKQAAETIDMTKHVGQHPRMGATDVIPFVPTMDVTLEETVALSKRVAERIWNELQIPSFLYEDSATRPERRNLAKCRKGQFEGMPEKLLEPDWAPDYGKPNAPGCRTPTLCAASRRSTAPSGTLWLTCGKRSRSSSTPSRTIP